MITNATPQQSEVVALDSTMSEKPRDPAPKPPEVKIPLGGASIPRRDSLLRPLSVPLVQDHSTIKTSIKRLAPSRRAVIWILTCSSIICLGVGVGAGAGAAAAAVAGSLDRSLPRQDLLTKGLIGGSIISLCISLNFQFFIFTLYFRKGKLVLLSTCLSVALPFASTETATAVLSLRAIGESKSRLYAMPAAGR